MKYINICLLTLSLIFLSTYKSFADTDAKDFRIKIVLIDSIKQNPIEFATVSITLDGKKEALKYALTDASGWAEILKVPEGSYTLKAECMGYAPYITKFNTTGKSLIDFGKVKMKEEVNTLSSITVSALANPIIVKKDTIEYNASSFKVTDGDMLETLLKKLPGIEIASDGSITANGKTINKITIDGKTFFLDDPQLATKNLPAKIIEKVKVLEKKSEQAQFTGIDDGNSETVIDLSIRPGMMNGWFGNMSAGYGTDDKYQAAGMLGNFTSRSQLSVIANANNTNNRGFFDVAGEAMRGMRNSLGGSGGVRVGGAIMNFGGSGITSSWMAGANANTESKNKKLSIGGSYLYSGNETENNQTINKQTFLTDSSFVYNSNQYSLSRSNANRASLNLEYKFNEMTSILFRPNINVGSGSFNEGNLYSTKGLLGEALINDGNSKSFGDNDTRTLGGDFLFRQKFNKTGRTFSVSITYGYEDNDIKAFNQSLTNSYGSQAMTSEVKQMYKTEQSNYSLGARAAYTEPLGNNYYMELAYSYNYKKNNSDKVANNFNTATQEYDLYDSTYSNSFENTFINQRGEINIRKVEDKYNYTIGMNVQPAYTHSLTTADGETTDLERNVVNFSPTAMLEINFSDTKALRLRYRGNTRQPSISQMQPVKDNSNPLYVSEGNPDLLPEFSHNLSVSYRNTDRATFSTVDARLEGTYTLDKIVNKTWYEEGGIQHTKPVNDQSVYSVSANIMWSAPVAKSKFYIMTNTRTGLNNGINYSSSTASETGAVKNLTTSFSLSEMLRVSYRGEKLETGIGGRVSYAKAWYTVGKTKDATWNNAINANINWTLPAGFALASDIDYQFYLGYGTGYNDPATVWNAEVSKLLLKNSATLRLRVFDILDQSKSVRRTTTDNYIQDVSSMTLKQYFMLSFTWRFGKFGDGNDRGRDRDRGMRGHGMYGPPHGGFPR